MIRTLVLLGGFLSAGHALADQECIKQSFPVTDVRLDGDGRIGVDFQNDTPFPVIGYDLSYVFYTDAGVRTEDLPTYILKQAIVPGAIHTHRMRLTGFEIEMAAVNDVKAHIVGVQQDVGIGQVENAPLAQLLEKCEDA